MAASLYPLHPATVAALAATARRFGQNERSVFSFLQSLEPHGFRRFAESAPYSADSWYRLPRVMDHLRAQGDLRMRPADRERRWARALDALAQADDMSDREHDLLKSVAMLAVLEPVAGLKADRDCLAWCVGCTAAEADAGLARLVSRNLVYRRPHREDWNLWSSSSVDLDGWLEKARAAVPTPRRIDAAAGSLPQSRPLVAHRHYHRTGTLRTFTVGATWDEGPGDGRVVVVPVHPDEDGPEALAATMDASRRAPATTVACLHPVTPADLRWAHELVLWRWVEANCEELRADDMARTEVATRVRAAEDELVAALAPLSRLSTDLTWVWRGEVARGAPRGGVSALLSDIADAEFGEAPTLRNELINRSKLSSAVASARMSLLERMITRGGEENLGMTGAPPERTIYRSMLQASGLHRQDADGNWGFGEPVADPLGWRPAWRRLERLVGEQGLIGFDRLAAELARPPVGLRAGPALVLAAAFMLANRRDIALMERGSFQPELTQSHFMRLAKTPSNFALRYLGGDGGRHALIERLASGLAILAAGQRPEAALKPLMERLYAWWGTLPAYALETRSLDRHATAVRHALRKGREPVDLIFEELPRACEALDARGEIDVDLFVERLDAALITIGDAEPLLRVAAAAALADAFNVRDLAALRRQMREEYAPHRLELADYRPRQFIERITVGEDDARMLDGVAGLLVSNRLDGWRDETLDRFAFSARELAGRLIRWLSALKLARTTRSDLKRIHVVRTDGTEDTVVVRSGAPRASTRAVEEQVRRLLADVPHPGDLLGRLLVEAVERQAQEERA